MGDQDSGKREVEFDKLNWVGKTIFLTGQVARAAEAVVETIVDQATSLVGAAGRAFIDGLDEDIDEAKILEEHAAAKKRSPRDKK